LSAGSAVERRQRGFTLLEVLIALLVLSLSLVALVKLSNSRACRPIICITSANRCWGNG